MRYVTSDLHFGHRNIFKFCPDTRPWADTEQMQQALIQAINSLAHCEMLYVLGDFYFGNSQQVRDIMDQIQVPITFVWGNHDSDKIRKIITEEYGCAGHDYYETKHESKKVVMFHYPIYRDWNCSHYGSIHLHGHLHGRDIGSNGKSLDVGWDAHGRILTLDEAVELADRNPVQSFHEVPGKVDTES